MKIPVEWLKQYISTKKSAKELAESFTNIGLMLDKPVFEYQDGKYATEVLDLEHRMDRADWLSLLGCARDLAAYEQTALVKPETHDAKPLPLDTKEKIKIEVKCPDLVNRFNTRVFKNIKVKPSPDWLKNRLQAYGLPSINNIVDITNYVMVELGQPLHAQDLSKLEKPEIVIRRAKKGEKITTLLGETLELDEDIFVLTQNDVPTVIGGIVGGVATGIDDSTTDIILDAGNYNQVNIRKSSRKLKIQNETVLRCDKFLHPELTEVAIRRATKLILELADGEYYENTDWYPNPMPLKKIILTIDRLNKIGGDLPINKKFIDKVLTTLEYKILKEDKKNYELEVPYFRTDVEVEDDVVADLLRIYGYPNIPAQDMNFAPPKDITPKIYRFEQEIANVCIELGLHEHITDPLVKSDETKPNQVKLENSQSQLKNALRTNIYDGLKNVAENYAKHKVSNIRLFEVGKTYSRANKSKDLKDFTETRITQVYILNASADPAENSIEVRKALDSFLTKLGITHYELTATETTVNIKVADTTLGNLTWDGFNVENEKLMSFWEKQTPVSTEFDTLNESDISLMVPADLKLGAAIKLVKELGEDEIMAVEVLPQDYKTADKSNVVMRITHKLTDFNPMRAKLVKELTAKLGIEIR
jgi:phenylalanyl-tRNA synthetase beta chain